MAVWSKLIAQARGDYGNPSGSGLAKITTYGVTADDLATALSRMSTFATALKTNNFTACNIGDITAVSKTIAFTTKPAGTPAVDIDDKIEVTWRTKQDDSIRSLTIPGCQVSSAVFEATDAGRRLTAAAKTTLEGLLTTLFALAEGNEAVVLYGKYIGKY
jgi:hypothetical protein